MSGPARTDSYRTRWSSNTYNDIPAENPEDWEKQIVADHLGSGWVQEKRPDTEYIFSIRLEDGKKWTRHYDRKTCKFICQRFYSVENTIKAMDWPKGSFGD